jgi:hypothetical protein
MSEVSADTRCVTINIPLDALGPVTVTAPPPALVSRVNAHHVGLDPDVLVRVLRLMSADPTHGPAVIACGKSFRAAPPDAVVAFLRSRSSPAEPTPAEPTPVDDDVDRDLLRAAGYAAPGETSPPPASTTRVRRRR